MPRAELPVNTPLGTLGSDIRHTSLLRPDLPAEGKGNVEIQPHSAMGALPASAVTGLPVYSCLRSHPLPLAQRLAPAMCAWSRRPAKQGLLG